MTNRRQSISYIPVPDPTKLTTDAVAQAKYEIEKLFSIQIVGINKDIGSLTGAVANIPGLTADHLASLRELIEEKFIGVRTEFTMRDIALAAAFKAAESAVKQQNESNTLAIDKAGTAFTKQIDGLDEKIDDIKERIAELARKDWSTVGAYIVGAVGISAIIIDVLLRHG